MIKKIPFIAILIIATMVLFAGFAFVQKPQQSPIVKKTVPSPTITPNPNGTIQLIVGIAPDKKIWIKNISKSSVPYPSKCDATVKAPFVTIVVVSGQKKVLFTCKKPTTLHGSSIPLINENNEIVEQAKKQDVQLTELRVFLPYISEKKTLQLYDTKGKLIIIKDLLQIQ